MKIAKKQQGLLVLILVLMALLLFAAPALADDTGWLSPQGNYADTGLEGLLPDNAANAYAQDDARAEFSSGWMFVWFRDRVHYTFANDPVPAGATITGIEVQLESYRTSSSQPVLSVQLWQDNQLRGSGKTAIPSTPADNDTYVTLGSASDAWGYTSWTAQRINDNFNLRLISSENWGSVYLDHIQVKIYYTPAAPSNNTPVAEDDTYATDEDTPLTVPAPGVLANDSDADGDTLTAAEVGDPQHGTLNLNSDGSFSYTPEPNYNGSDSFTYCANDGTSGSSPASISIIVNAVNDAPVAVADNYSVDEDSELRIAAPGVLSNDSDVEGDTINAYETVSVTSHGHISLQADGSFIYMPNANYNGMDSFSYRISDGDALSNVATVSITVNPVADPPLAVDNSYSVDEDHTLNIAASGVLANDADVDGDALTATLVSGPAHGTLNLNGNGSFSYTPQANYSGPDSFSYSASDGSLSDTAVANITVNPVNDAPVLTQINDQRIEEGETCSFRATASDVDRPADILTFSLIGAPKGAKIDASSGVFTWKPSGSQIPGSYTFSMRVSDNGSPARYDEQEVTVSVHYKDYQFKIKATAGDGGSIDPKGDTWVYRGDDITFMIKPDQGYQIEDVLVDDKSIGAVKKYEFEKVKTNHTIKAVFSRICSCDRFIDIDTRLWYHDGIDFVIGKGLFQGISANQFGPDLPMTRAMLVTVLYRLDGMPDVFGMNPFLDVESSSWYSGAVIWAVGHGIVKGVDGEHFAPNDNLSREQLVAILYRYAIYKGYVMSGGDDPGISIYSDAGDISDYAVPAMEWACKKGIIEGNSPTTINPLALATRAEVAIILMRFVREISK
jgi:VCBS repeat-containing protein